MKKRITIVIDDAVLDEYAAYYFTLHPRAVKRPIEKPYHPTMNSWMIMKRPQMNALKQKWKEFVIWLVRREGYENLGLERCGMRLMTYYATSRRHDVDAGTPKFILDGFAESGMIVDDDYLHLRPLVLDCGVDKDRPRTEIEVFWEE